MNYRSKMKKSFTLIEIMTIIAIIALLIAILLPALNRAREVAKSQVAARELSKDKVEGRPIVAPVELRDSDGCKYDVITIDGCEYIRYERQYHHAFSITHKGDCKNPIHQYRAEK